MNSSRFIGQGHSGHLEPFQGYLFGDCIFPNFVFLIHISNAKLWPHLYPIFTLKNGENPTRNGGTPTRNGGTHRRHFRCPETAVDKAWGLYFKINGGIWSIQGHLVAEIDDLDPFLTVGPDFNASVYFKSEFFNLVKLRLPY